MDAEALSRVQEILKELDRQRLVTDALERELRELTGVVEPRKSSRTLRQKNICYQALKNMAVR